MVVERPGPGQGHTVNAHTRLNVFARGLGGRRPDPVDVDSMPLSGERGRQGQHRLVTLLVTEAVRAPSPGSGMSIIATRRQAGLRGREVDMATFAMGCGGPPRQAPCPAGVPRPSAIEAITTRRAAGTRLARFGPLAADRRTPTVRLVYVTETYPPEINGVALTVQRAVSHLRRQGHDLTLVRPQQRDEGPLDSRHEWRTAGLPLPMYPDLRFGLAWPGQWRERLLQWRPELVHLATPGPLAWAALHAARALDIPVTAEFRTNFHLYSAHYGLSWLSPWCLRVLRAITDCP